MKNNKLNKSSLPGWKTIQFFISSSGVCEVEISEELTLRCSCDGFTDRRKCRHVNWCSSQIKQGMYPIEITSKAIPDEVIEEAQTSTEAFRNLILKYGKPLVL